MSCGASEAKEALLVLTSRSILLYVRLESFSECNYTLYVRQIKIIFQSSFISKFLMKKTIG